MGVNMNEVIDFAKRDVPQSFEETDRVFQWIFDAINVINPNNSLHVTDDQRADISSNLKAVLLTIKEKYIEEFSLAHHAMFTVQALNDRLNNLVFMNKHMRRYFVWTSDGMFLDEFHGEKALEEYLGVPWKTINSAMLRGGLVAGLYVSVRKQFDFQRGDYVFDACPFDRREFVAREYLMLNCNEIIQEWKETKLFNPGELKIRGGETRNVVKKITKEG